MVRKKIDNRVRVLIENGINLGHRTMFAIVGDKARDQVVILHHMLSKATVRSRPTVLWCYKEKLGFSTHRKKRMRLLQRKKKSGNANLNEDDPFELFIAATNIRFCYYNETHKILGNTYGMLILQDFEAMTPNLLARTIETIEGGGIVAILMQSVKSLKQLYTMSMDVHWRFRTEAHQEVVGRFNERFILSLGSCKKALVVDDQLNVLPISSHAANIQPVTPSNSEDKASPEEKELREIKESLQDTPPVGPLAACCKTRDQAKALLKFVEAISEKTLRATVTLTAARGRGKSAALGLAIAAAVGFGYSNIFVTSPSPENLKTLFEFLLKGFDALHYQEHLDYELIQSTNPEFNKAVVRLNIFRDHRQTVQYIHPGDANKLGQAELVVIDEAAAIPLPLVKALLGPYLVFMASTINGYEGTGRSLSLKLIQQLRQQSATMTGPAATGRTLHEVTLDESIRYQMGDDVEDWLNRLLCLNATVTPLLTSGCPLPLDCELFYVNRDTLFSFHAASEQFLQQLMALYVASHYKNSPNDLQMLSDAPAHHLFCLLPPTDPNTRALPEVLCVLQVCLEGDISKSSVQDAFSRGKRASGDLIPWTVSQQFQDQDFPSLSGARVVRIATHPDYQKMGYGSHSLKLLQEYFEGQASGLHEEPMGEVSVSEEGLRHVEESTVGNLLEESLSPRASLPPLLLRLGERTPEHLQYLGVSYGLTSDLMKFWKRAGFTPVYLRQTANDLTGEHSCIMLKSLCQEGGQWLRDFWVDFRRRFINLLSFQFREFKPSLALSILQNKIGTVKRELNRRELNLYLTSYDLKRLEMYSQNLVDHHLIMDLLPTLARLYFLDQMADTHLSAVQGAILLSLGLQHKTVETVSMDLDLPTSQLLGLYNRSIRRLTQYLQRVTEKDIEGTLPAPKSFEQMQPLAQSLDQDLQQEPAVKPKKKSALTDASLEHFAIKGSEDEWGNALQGASKTLVSIKSIHKNVESEEKPEFKNKPYNKKRKWK